MGNKIDRGWDYLNSASDENFDYDPDNDGSWGYQNEDGSGSYYGADGSWGYKNSDGSGSYYGNDGSWGYRNADGSSSYYGNDGSWGYRNSDGSGSFYEADGDSHYYDSDDEDEDEDDDSEETSSNLSDSGEALATMLGFGLAAYMAHKSKKDQERQEEQERQERERIQREVAERARQERARERRKKRFAFYGRHWKAILLLIIILAGSGFGYFKYTELQKLVEVGVSSSTLVGQDYLSVEKTLQSAGFTNIHEDAVNDLKIDDAKKEGLVTIVSIGGDEEFEATDRYPYDTRVEITYHLVKNISVPTSAKAAKKENYADLAAAFKNAGFVNVKTEAEYDLVTGWITKDGSVESISVDGETSFDEYASFRPDVEVIITYHTFSKNKDD